MAQKKQIALLYTGGTIGMLADANGLSPSKDTVLAALDVYQAHVNWQITVAAPLIDSSQVTPQNWREWQQWVRLQDCDGILVLHGTDSMAYTANVLAFALGQTDIPIVITGAQHPLGTPEGDAEANLEAAVQVLLQDAAPNGVSLVFDGELMAAVGSRKISTQHAHGFANKYGRVLARFEQGQWQSLQAACDISEHAHCVTLAQEFNIASWYCLPVSSQNMLRCLLQSAALDALIVQSFGHGNGLFDEDDVAALQAFQAGGGVVVNVSQVADGQVAAAYAASKALRDAGVLAAGAWTVETAYAKLLVGLNMGLSGDALRQMLQQDWLGEWQS